MEKIEETIKPEEKTKKEKLKKDKTKKKRFEWLDQFRGLIIILFIVQTMAYLFSGDPLNGIVPAIAPHLNHGYKFFKFERPIITIMDIGQQIFIFLVGFMQGFAILRRMGKNTDQKQLWLHIIKRFLLVIFLSIVHSFGKGEGFNVYFIFFEGTMANIAWAGLAAGIAAIYIPKADHRLFVGLGFMLIHSILYAIPNLNAWESGDWYFPYRVINHIAIGIVATAYTSWFFTQEGEINKETIRSRVLPVSTAFFIAEYLLDFIQWSDHHDVTTPLAMLALASSGFLIFIFYKMDEEDFHILGLTAFGKNMLSVFILEMVIIELLYLPIIEGIVGLNAFLDMLILGMVPVVLIWIIAKLLEKFDIIIKV
ncbi:MAG: hypothetical protein ACTSYI_06845 [Promethearchaeota archaeon]